jgi:GrpB-like predicted nucleotidyltransferase (UPF0157 family)
LKDLEKAKEKLPNDPEIAREIARCRRAIAEQEKKDRQLYTKMFASGLFDDEPPKVHAAQHISTTHTQHTNTHASTVPPRSTHVKRRHSTAYTAALRLVSCLRAVSLACSGWRAAG